MNIVKISNKINAMQHCKGTVASLHTCTTKFDSANINVALYIFKIFIKCPIL